MNKGNKEMKKAVGQESFEDLAQYLVKMNEAFLRSAASAVNKHVTCRNWLNGFYIVHYEQNGSDRAKYGENLLQKLSERLRMKGYSYRDLRLYRQFFQTYMNMQPAILEYVINDPEIWQPPIAKLESAESGTDKIWQSVIAKLPTKDENHDIIVPADNLFNRLSYTHFVQLLPIEDPLERAFYEIECMNGVWSTRELKRQIESNYFKRSGLSRDKDALRELANKGAVQQNLAETVKSPFVFEFLGLDAKDVVEESELESALMDHLQDFMLELGNGFCFEARQKRILVDEEYYYYSATRTSRCQTSSVNVSAAINTSHQGLTASRTSPSTNNSSVSSRNWRYTSSTAVIYIIRIACGDSSVRKTHWHTSSRFS